LITPSPPLNPGSPPHRERLNEEEGERDEERERERERDEEDDEELALEV